MYSCDLSRVHQVENVVVQHPREEIDAEGNNVQQEQNESDNPCQIQHDSLIFAHFVRLIVLLENIICF